MKSTRERRYRGYCITDMSLLDPTFSYFREKKEAIYGVYTNSPLVDNRYVKSTIKFLDEFYETIADKKSIERDFGYPCNKHGTGNVVITGLKKR